MRIHLTLISLLLYALADAHAQAISTQCADLHLVPAVRECSAMGLLLVGESGVRVVAENNAEDEFASKDLEDSFKSHDVSFTRRGATVIRLERTESSPAKELLARSEIRFDSSMHDEGYVLVPDGKRGLAVIAETSAGIFYGAQTVKQLICGHGKDAVLLVPTVRDWPAMAYRGLSDDWSRGPLPNMEFLKREIRTLAAYKYNIFSPYFEHTFLYASTPVAAFPGGSMTPAEARELVEYAAAYHIIVIPEQESFGHLHHVLKFQQYSSMGETAHGAVLAPEDVRSLPQIRAWFGDLANVFSAPYVHIGADETFELGLGRTRDEVDQKGLSTVYLDFLSKIHETLAPYNKRLLFWGDIALKSPDLVKILPKDMIAVPWRYSAEPDFDRLIIPFTRAGLETWVAPGVSNWSRVYPNNNEALGNIRAFVRDGQKLGATGELITVWNDDGETIFDANWFGVLFGAAAGWQKGESSEQNFLASYAWAFHGDRTDKIDKAQQALMAAHSLLRKAGLGDAQNTYFWLDPFSPEGQQVSIKLLPVAAELRLDAEKAITLLAEARATEKLYNLEALDAMELAARKIDFIGYKFQAASECVSIYSQALTLEKNQNRWNEVQDLLLMISSENGRIQDIRDGYALLGEQFRMVWLRDYRPYWLAINMARYNSATQLWIERGDRFEWNRYRWRTEHTLLSATEVGLPAQ